MIKMAQVPLSFDEPSSLALAWHDIAGNTLGALPRLGRRLLEKQFLARGLPASACVKASPLNSSVPVMASHHLAGAQQ